MHKRFQYSKATDVDRQHLTPTDVKQFAFCPRVTFFTRVMRLKPIMGSQQKAAHKSHDRIGSLEKKRKSLLKVSFPFDIARKEFDVFLISQRHRLQGRLDMLVQTRENEWIPVEFKDMVSKRRESHLDHKYQLTALALLVEEKENTIVRRGILHYLKDESTIVQKITHNMKSRAMKYLERIWGLLENEEMPEVRRICRTQSIGCGFSDLCQEI